MGDQAGHQAYGLRCELIGHQEDVSMPRSPLGSSVSVAQAPERCP